MGQGAQTRSLLDAPLKVCPEVLLLGMAQLKVRAMFCQLFVCLSVLWCLWLPGRKTESLCTVSCMFLWSTLPPPTHDWALANVQANYGTLQAEVFSALLPAYLAIHPNSSIVLHRVWPLQRDAILKCMVEVHGKDNSQVSRMLDICQDLKVQIL